LWTRAIEANWDWLEALIWISVASLSLFIFSVCLNRLTHYTCTVLSISCRFDDWPRSIHTTSRIFNDAHHCRNIHMNGALGKTEIRPTSSLIDSTDTNRTIEWLDEQARRKAGATIIPFPNHVLMETIVLIVMHVWSMLSLQFVLRLMNSFYSNSGHIGTVSHRQTLLD
jgi:hypothetical protein